MSSPVDELADELAGSVTLMAQGYRELLQQTQQQHNASCCSSPYHFSSSLASASFDSELLRSTPPKALSGAIATVLSWLQRLFEHEVQCKGSFVTYKVTVECLGDYARSLLMPTLQGFGVTHMEQKHLAQLLVQACMHCIVVAADGKSVVVPGRVRILCLVATKATREGSCVSDNSAVPVRPIAQTELLEGVLVDWQMPLEAQIAALGNNNPNEEGGTFELRNDQNNVVIFSCSLQLDDNSNEKKKKSESFLLLRLLSHMVHRHSIGFVASQRLIDPAIRSYLMLEHGVICVERLSLRHVKAVATLCGCEAVPSLQIVRSAFAHSSHNDSKLSDNDESDSLPETFIGRAGKISAVKMHGLLSHSFCKIF